MDVNGANAGEDDSFADEASVFSLVESEMSSIAGKSGELLAYMITDARYYFACGFGPRCDSGVQERTRRPCGQRWSFVTMTGSPPHRFFFRLHFQNQRDGEYYSTRCQSAD